MRPAKRIIAIVIVLALGFWLWTVLFPSPEKIIRKHLHETAAAASFAANEGELARALNASKLSGYFANEVDVRINYRGTRQDRISRDDITRAAMHLRNEFRELKITFLDLNVTLLDHKTKAEVDLTMRASTPGEPNFMVQEMKFTLRKIDGKWLIIAVETVKTLSYSPREITRQASLQQRCLPTSSPVRVVHAASRSNSRRAVKRHECRAPWPVHRESPGMPSLAVAA